MEATATRRTPLTLAAEEQEEIRMLQFQVSELQTAPK
jgi:hypothetical protein